MQGSENLGGVDIEVVLRKVCGVWQSINRRDAKDAGLRSGQCYKVWFSYSWILHSFYL